MTRRSEYFSSWLESLFNSGNLQILYILLDTFSDLPYKKDKKAFPVLPFDLIKASPRCNNKINILKSFKLLLAINFAWIIAKKDTQNSQIYSSLYLLFKHEESKNIFSINFYHKLINSLPFILTLPIDRIDILEGRYFVADYVVSDFIILKQIKSEVLLNYKNAYGENILHRLFNNMRLMMFSDLTEYMKIVYLFLELDCGSLMTANNIDGDSPIKTLIELPLIYTDTKELMLKIFCLFLTKYQGNLQELFKLLMQHKTAWIEAFLELKTKNLSNNDVQEIYTEVSELKKDNSEFEIFNIYKLVKDLMLQRGLLKTKAMLEKENAQLRKQLEDLKNGRSLPFWQTTTMNNNSNNNNQPETPYADCQWFPDHAM